MTVRFRVDEGEAGRADKVVAARFPGVGRRQLAALFARGAVRIDGRVAHKGERVPAGALVALDEAPAAARALAPVAEPDAALDILYQDAHVVVLSKPPGVPGHPLRAGERGTLASALVARFPCCASASDDAREAGLAHRLDTGTSGILLAARHREAWLALREAFSRGAVEKRYLALVESADIGDGVCDAPLARQARRMVVATGHRAGAALPAVTRWRVVQRAGSHTLLECVARTGRMHQVRVHLAHAGAPIAGDLCYGGAALPAPMAGHFLHASALALPHPITHARLDLEAPLPPDRVALLDALRPPRPA